MLLAVVLVGCGSSVSPSPAQSVGAFLASPAPIASASAPPTFAPTATPTPDPEALRKTAAAAYLAAANKSNAAQAALDKKYPGAYFKSLKQAHAYFKAAAAIDGQFIAAIKKIQPPPDTAGDLHALIARDAATQASEIELSQVSSADYNGAYKVWLSRARASTAAANLVRVDLGLPPVN